MNERLIEVSKSNDNNIIVKGIPNLRLEHIGRNGKVDIKGFRNNKLILNQTIVSPLISSTSYFGKAVSLSADGSTLAIGDPYLDGSGSVHIYSHTEGYGFEHMQTLRPEHQERDSNFGCSVSFNKNGKVLAIGEYGRKGIRPRVGRISIYKLGDNFWNRVSTIEPTKSNMYHFGEVAAISPDGKYLATTYLEDTGVDNIKHVRLYELDNRKEPASFKDLKPAVLQDRSNILKDILINFSEKYIRAEGLVVRNVNNIPTINVEPFFFRERTIVKRKSKPKIIPGPPVKPFRAKHYISKGIA